MESDDRVRVEFDGERLCLVERHDRWGRRFDFPDRPGAGTVALAFVDAIHARIHPIGTAEEVFAAWSRGEKADRWAPATNPAVPPPVKRRGAAVVLAADRVLLIRYPPESGRRYFIPGGGVEPGETAAEAAIRELREETGLSGVVERPLAVVYNRGREEHYFLVSVPGPIGRLVPLDLEAGETLEWIGAADLPTTAVWPKRLAWRVTHWWRSGWPDEPVVLADSSGDLDSPCDW